MPPQASRQGACCALPPTPVARAGWDRASALPRGPGTPPLPPDRHAPALGRPSLQLDREILIGSERSLRAVPRSAIGVPASDAAPARRLRRSLEWRGTPPR
jgi:hypothetical protein